MISIASPAKLNLFLEVVNKRPDGYHNIDSIFIKINLFDNINIDFTNNELIETVTNHPLVPDGPENIVYKAADAIRKYFNRSDGMCINITKHIPVGGGLGGGSSNAASVIKALCRYWHEPYDTPDIAHIAASIGADVPFFLTDHLIARCKGIGEQIEPINSDAPLLFVIVNPNICVSTGTIYARTDLQKKRKNSDLFLKDFAAHDVNNIGNKLFNRMQPVVSGMYPVIDTILSDLKEAGSINAIMSGSGSTLFGLIKDNLCAEKVVEHIRYRYPDYFSSIVKSLHGE